MKTKPKQWNAKQKDEDKRLDLFLNEKLDTSRSQIKNKIEAGRVSLNSERAKKAGEMLSAEDIIKLFPKPEKSDEQADKELKEVGIEIVKETKDYLVIVKPSGLLVHPTAKKEKVTLVRWLLNKYPNIKTVGEFDDRPGIVHRLDRDTSGLLIIAKNQKMFEHLKKQFKQRKVEKEYTALAHRVIESDQDVIKFPVGRGNDGKMAAHPEGNNRGKRAITKITTKKRFSRYSLVNVKIITGRTHQIRVHMYAYGHPLVGDKLYQQKDINKNLDKKLDRVFLHAHKLCFYDLKNQKICVESDLPEKLQSTLEDIN